MEPLIDVPCFTKVRLVTAVDFMLGWADTNVYCNAERVKLVTGNQGSCLQGTKEVQYFYFAQNFDATVKQTSCRTSSFPQAKSSTPNVPTMLLPPTSWGAFEPSVRGQGRSISQSKWKLAACTDTVNLICVFRCTSPGPTCLVHLPKATFTSDFEAEEFGIRFENSLLKHILFKLRCWRRIQWMQWMQ